METVDLKRSKQLTRILTGQEPPIRRSTHAEKLHKVQTQMTAKDVLKDLKEARELLRNIAPDPGLEQTGILFFYKRKYLFVTGGELTKPGESEVKSMLDVENKIKIYFICSENICPMPGILSGKEKTAKKVKDDAEAVAFMSKTAGIEIKESDL